jgi:hypothetical protein
MPETQADRRLIVEAERLGATIIWPSADREPARGTGRACARVGGARRSAGGIDGAPAANASSARIQHSGRATPTRQGTRPGPTVSAVHTSAGRRHRPAQHGQRSMPRAQPPVPTGGSGVMAQGRRRMAAGPAAPEPGAGRSDPARPSRAFRGTEAAAERGGQSGAGRTVDGAAG